MSVECEKCGSKEKTYDSFGHWICKKCLQKRKTGKKGHSGMIYNKDTCVTQTAFVDDGLYLLKCQKSHPIFVKWYLEHYPESKGICGRQFNYLIYYNKKPIGIIGANSPPLNYKIFNSYFNIDGSGESCKYFMNNNVYRIVHSRINFGTQILKLFRDTLLRDYYNKYNQALIGLITFVEPPRTGSIYKADNWVYLGETQGISIKRRGEKWVSKQYSVGTVKHIFGFKYREKDYRRVFGNHYDRN